MCVGRIPESTTGLKNLIIPWENTAMAPGGSNAVSPTAFLRAALKLPSLHTMPLASVTAVKASLFESRQPNTLPRSEQLRRKKKKSIFYQPTV